MAEAARAQKCAIISAWMVHLFTASGAVVALLTFDALLKNNYRLAFLLMAISIFIDALDGTLARKFRVKIWARSVDGELLDNLVDYLNYVITPAYLLLVNPSMLPEGARVIFASLIALSSAYQFAHIEAKTDDNFFRGFPSYWNIAVFYLYIFDSPPWLNIVIISALVLMVFIPIKYLYLSRMTHVTKSLSLRRVIMSASVIFALANLLLLIPDDKAKLASSIYIWLYIFCYFAVSVYRTLRPLEEE